MKRRKAKVGPVCVILHLACTSSCCEDESLPQLTGILQLLLLPWRNEGSAQSEADYSFKSKPVSDTTFISGAAGFQDSCPHILPVMRLRTRTSHLVKDCHLPCGSVTSEMREVPAAWHP